MMKAREILLYLAIKHKGNFDEMYSAIKAKEKIAEQELKETIKSFDGKYVTIIDEDYPPRLKSIFKPPLVLFYKGNYELINENRPLLSVVGSREASSYSNKMVGEICEEMAKKGVGIISGLAKGIDTSALSSANKYGKAIAILGTSLTCYYPAENSELQDKIGTDGLLLSEFPPGVGPSKANFPLRNRIMVGLSKSLLVGEVKRKSGTLISVSLALEMGSEIGVLPFRANEDVYNNKLIQEGAYLIASSDDLLSYFSTFSSLREK